jgi:hypothetical protein
MIKTYQCIYGQEAAQTVVYVQNKSPHHVLGNKTPEEMFTGEKPEVSHLSEDIWLSSVCACSQVGDDLYFL